MLFFIVLCNELDSCIILSYKLINTQGMCTTVADLEILKGGFSLIRTQAKFEL